MKGTVRAAGLALALMALGSGRAQAAPRVLGGAPAGPSLTMVARIVDRTITGARLCSGTVVAPTLVLTAAHCAIDPVAADYSVQTGTDAQADTGQFSAVGQVMIDPAYDATDNDNDAALLELSTASTASPVSLSTSPAATGTSAVVAGWGIDDSAGDTATTLQQGSTIVQDPNTCAQLAASANAAFDPAGELCTTDSPTDGDGACEGDSGGPLLSSTATGWVELAIVSWGAADCDTSFPDYFTRADAVAAWVNAQIAASQAAASAVTAPSPTVIAVDPAPRAGIYRGQTSQHRSIRLQITAARTALRDARLTVNARCRRRRRVTATVSLPQQLTLALRRGLGFDARVGSGQGYRVHWQGTFSATGRAVGSLIVSWTSRSDGGCSSGPVAWRVAR